MLRNIVIYSAFYDYKVWYFFCKKNILLTMVVLFLQSLRILKASDLKPYIVFIAPPNLEKLRQQRYKAGGSTAVSNHTICFYTCQIVQDMYNNHSNHTIYPPQRIFSTNSATRM